MAKLALRIRKDAMEKARRISRQQGRSVEEFLTEFLRSLPEPYAEDTAVKKRTQVKFKFHSVISKERLHKKIA